MQTKVVQLTELEILNLKYAIKEQQKSMIRMARYQGEDKQKEVMDVYHELEETYQKLESALGG